MYDIPKIQFAFQGGGAKLASLLAVAEYLQELEKRNEIVITRVAGTSAGAIVAVLLAAEVDIKKFTIFLENNIDNYLKELNVKSLENLKFYKKINLLFKFLMSKPFLDINILKNIFSDILFEFIDEDKKELSQLKKEIIIISSNINTKRTKIFSRQDEIDIINALLHSCSLPIIFRSANDLNNVELVDGGLFNNLPIKYLQDQKSKYGKPLAISFKENFDEKRRLNTFQYCLKLLTSMIDNNVSTTKSDLKNDTFLIETTLNTLDFKNIKSNLSSSSNYKLIKSNFSKWFNMHLEKLGNSITEYSLDTLLSINSDIYDKYIKNKKPKISFFSMKVICNCLFPKNTSNIYSEYDEILKIWEFENDTNNYAVNINYSFGNSKDVMIMPQISVLDENNEPVEFLIIPAKKLESNIESTILNKNIIIFILNQNSICNKKRFRNKVVMKEKSHKCFYDLIEKGMDTIGFFNSTNQTIEHIELLLQLPKNFSNVHPLVNKHHKVEKRADFSSLNKCSSSTYEETLSADYKIVGWELSKLLSKENFILDIYNENYKALKFEESR